MAQFALHVTGRPLAQGFPVPANMLSWNVAAFAIAEAVHGHVVWSRKAEHKRRRAELDTNLERMLERDYRDSGFAVGQGRRAIPNARNLLLRAKARGKGEAIMPDRARAEARQYLLNANAALKASETALSLAQRLVRKRWRLLADENAYMELVKAWGHYLREATNMMFRLGAVGYLHGAMTVDSSGQPHPVQPDAWSATHNIEAFNARRLLHPGDEPLAPPGMPCVPVDVVKEWVRLIELYKSKSIADAELLISGKQRPGETDYEWLYRRGVRGTIVLAEALEYLRSEAPGADPEVLKKRAKSLVSTSRTFPGARKRRTEQQAKRARRKVG
ncbi:MAG: hypothetical protein EON93_03415 [Burkholderiales bacterium]|nr:MAG: hypothetical protein EON93_03415 [Burkholderiales bacterium]